MIDNNSNSCRKKFMKCDLAFNEFNKYLSTDSSNINREYQKCVVKLDDFCKIEFIDLSDCDNYSYRVNVMFDKVCFSYVYSLKSIINFSDLTLGFINIEYIDQLGESPSLEIYILQHVTHAYINHINEKIIIPYEECSTESFIKYIDHFIDNALENYKTSIGLYKENEEYIKQVLSDIKEYSKWFIDNLLVRRPLNIEDYLQLCKEKLDYYNYCYNNIQKEVNSTLLIKKPELK